MTYIHAIERLKTLLKQMAEQAKQVDLYNSTIKAHQALRDNPLFSETLFSTYSDKFIHYVNECSKHVDEVAHLIKKHNNALAQLALEKVENQINALSTALKANATMHYDSQYRLDKRKAFFKQKQVQKAQEKAVKAVVMSSQSLYQKLAEHHEFERRLATMIAEREMQRAKCSDKQAEKHTQEILTLHQRLGRCRHAITQIERDIERAEKRL